jgi:hypothetical protein
LVFEVLKERRISKMKKIFLGTLVGTLILGTVSIAMAGPFTWRETRQQARIYQVWIVVRLHIGNFGISRGNKEELRPIGSRPGLMEHLPLVKHAV